LAHRCFETLLEQPFHAWSRADVHQWVHEKMPKLLEQEGATLLLYGREPERNVFLNRIRHAAWSLITLLRDNDWQVEGTEYPLKGEFAGVPVKGRADLVLRRGEERAIVDLKWSGATWRLEQFRNREDLQLVLYAHLLAPNGPWPHTAYFILEQGRMVARGNAAFKQAQAADSAANHDAVCAHVLAQMEKTFAWRMEQLRAGQLELRSARTAPDLDAHYGEVLLDLLEMKNEDSRWDDYRVLLEFLD
ncbi:MAG: PD-(D/E)XK nuclease family protein, partial [Saprospiraceae bacterium]